MISERKGYLSNSLINPPKAGCKGTPKVRIGRDQNKLLELCLSRQHAIEGG